MAAAFGSERMICRGRGRGKSLPAGGFEATDGTFGATGTGVPPGLGRTGLAVVGGLPGGRGMFGWFAGGVGDVMRGAGAAARVEARAA